MRYSQSREQCAELLRLVLARLGQHDAAYNPVTFTVWFEYLAGTNAQLNKAVDHLLLTQSRLSNDDMHHLYDDFVTDIDPQAMHRIGNDLRQVMSRVMDASSRTGSDAGEFGSQLERLVSDLQQASGDAVLPAVTQALEGTARMRQSAHQLEHEVRSSQSEIERLQGELHRVREESQRDALTQVLNRKGFDHKLAEMLVMPVLHDRVHGLIMYDIDHFKNVNDLRGHVMGDRVLQAVGEVLKDCVPANSVVTVARYGGEEFAMLVPNGSAQQCEQLAELVRTRIKALKIRDRRTNEVVLTVTISAGVALLRPEDTADTLTMRADAALYQSKHEGRDRVSVIA